MDRTRILHLADLHLGSAHDYLGPRADERREEADTLLSRLAEHALQPESGIGGVLIAGDLFDLHDPPPRLAERVLHDLSRLEAGGIRVCTVPGNHDEYSYANSVYRREAGRWPGTLVTAPAPERVARWDLAGHAVDLYAMAYTAGRSRPPFDRFPVEPGPARKIAILHGSLDVAWTDRSLPLRAENLGGLGVDYVALGHIHRPAERRLGSAWACYPGRIEGGGFEDPGGAGLVVIDPTAPEIKPIRSAFPSRSVRTERWNLSGVASEDDLAARIEAIVDPQTIQRLILSGLPGFRLRPEKLSVQFASRFFFLEINAGEAAAPPPDLAEAAAETSVRGVFAQIALERIASAPASQRSIHEAALRFGWTAFGADGGGGDPGGGGAGAGGGPDGSGAERAIGARKQA